MVDLFIARDLETIRAQQEELRLAEEKEKDAEVEKVEETNKGQDNQG